MKTYIFDLDGVLIDSAHMMEQSWNICELEHKLTQPFSEYFKHIGKPFRDIMKELGIDEVEAVKHTYDKASLELMEYCLEFYDDVETVLGYLKQENKIAVVTSKTAERTNVILDRLDVEFDYVVSPKKGLRGKPAPDQILFCLAMTQTDPKDAVYIGDMQVDYEAATRAGIDFIHASYGYGKCDHSVKSIKNLNSLLD
jgi:HAD superfamily hydrolase (TIGR01509 family)